MDEQRAALLDETRRFWQARYSRPFTLEDARVSVENVTGFFATLQRWSTLALSSGPDSTPTKEVVCKRSM